MTGSRFATIALSVGALVLLVAAFMRVRSERAGTTARPERAAYRTLTRPFDAGSIEGRILVLSTGGQQATARCDDAGGGTRAVAWVEGPTEGATPSGGARVLSLDDECGFDPAVSFAMNDDSLRIRASAEHRVQAWLGGVRVFDAAEPGNATITPSTPGPWQIRCASGHAGEEAWVVVVRNPYADVVDRDGAFRIAGIPAGRWTLATWHPAFGKRRTEVEIRAKEATPVELRY